MKKVIVIGSGFSGLAAAASLAAEGFHVTVFEKNATPGGRARQLTSEGFVFDMGPSWYWMPDVFEKFFARFDKKVSDYYALKRIDPSYRIFYGHRDSIDVPAGVPALSKLFELIEQGSGERLKQFLLEGQYKYERGMNDLVYRARLSWRELVDIKLLRDAWRLNLLQSHAHYVRKFFKSPRLIGLLEFPVLFLGASPERIPALYSLMNYADMALGTWYPMGGMHSIVDAMVQVAAGAGVTFRYNAAVSRIVVHKGVSTGVMIDEDFVAADFIVAAAEYRHVEQDLLPESSRQYAEEYWESRTLAPSCLIFYVGINKRISGLLHHTLFFDESIENHLGEIYDHPKWPRAPQFYVCCPSKTDRTVAPEGCENLFILIPVAPGLDDQESIREKYFAMVMHRIETLTGEKLLPYIIFKKSYAHNDFTADYNAYQGNAYGLANTLLQTANFKPRMKSSKVDNLFFAGQFTAPGPGVPPSIISGQVAAATLVKAASR